MLSAFVQVVHVVLLFNNHLFVVFLIFQLQVDLNTDTAVVLGQGNVSLDLARMLLTPIDILAVSSDPFTQSIGLIENSNNSLVKSCI